jgi:hypothetical protein
MEKPVSLVPQVSPSGLSIINQEENSGKHLRLCLAFCIGYNTILE